MKQAFTLMEMQAAVLIGLIVTALAGAFLNYEYERQFRMDEQAQIRMTARAIDATLQWACFQAVAMELLEDGLLIYTADHIWQLKGNDLLRNGRSMIDHRMTVQFSGIQLSGVRLELDVDLASANFSEGARFEYVLDNGAVGL